MQASRVSPLDKWAVIPAQDAPQSSHRSRLFTSRVYSTTLVILQPLHGFNELRQFLWKSLVQDSDHFLRTCGAQGNNLCLVNDKRPRAPGHPAVTAKVHVSGLKLSDRLVSQCFHHSVISGCVDPTSTTSRYVCRAVCIQASRAICARDSMAGLSLT